MFLASVVPCNCYRNLLFVLVCLVIVKFAVSIGKRNVTVQRPSVRPYVCPSVCPTHLLTLMGRAAHTQCDSPGGSTRRVQHTFPSETDLLVTIVSTDFCILFPAVSFWPGWYMRCSWRCSGGDNRWRLHGRLRSADTERLSARSWDLPHGAAPPTRSQVFPHSSPTWRQTAAAYRHTLR